MPSAQGLVTTLSRADNRLYGFQLGADRSLWDNGNGLHFDGLAKVGVYGNDADVVSQGLNGSGSNSDTDAAFIGELGLNAKYDVTQRLSVSTGYQLLFLDGVALAANQVPNSGNMNGGANNVPVNVSSASLLYHGLRTGLEYRW